MEKIRIITILKNSTYFLILFVQEVMYEEFILKQAEAQMLAV